MSKTLLTLALDQPISAYLLEQVLKSKHVNILKLGLWSFVQKLNDGTSYTQLAQNLCAQFGIPIFWDLKLSDTPDTNTSVIKALPQGGYVTITTPLYLPDNLQKMVELCQERLIVPIAVPITSATERHPLLPSVTRQGFFLSELARVMNCGFKDVVCDGHLLSYLEGISVQTHVPGIRPKWYQARHNHQNPIEPAGAAHLGAHNIIIGRPIMDQLTLRDMLYYLEMVRHEIDTAAPQTT